MRRAKGSSGEARSHDERRRIAQECETGVRLRWRRNRRSSLGQRLVKTGLKIGAFHPLLVGRTPRAFGFAETGTGFDTRS